MMHSRYFNFTFPKFTPIFIACFVSFCFPGKLAFGQILRLSQTHPQIGSFCDDVLRRLPPQMSEALEKSAARKGHPIGIRFVAPQQTQMLGKSDFLRNEIQLNPILLQAILETKTPPVRLTPGTPYWTAVATLIHELSHFYDRAEPLRTRLTHRSDWIRRLGWKRSGTRIVPLSKIHLKTLDPYEFKNIREYFAVQMEHFLTDPTYFEKRPAEDEFLSKHFGFRPFPSSAEERDYPVQVDLLNNTLGRDPTFLLNPDKIAAIHYLYAEGGERLGSRFGHSMFRLVVCSEKPSDSNDCLKEVSLHKVISFRADIKNEAVLPWKTLLGGYSSRAFFFRYSDVQEEFSQERFKSLASIPLLLSPDEKRRFLHRFLELNWESRGNYSLIFNNCTVESSRLLESALEPFKKINAITPLGLWKSLEQMDRIAPIGPIDYDSKQETPYFTPSKRAVAEKAFEVIASEISEGSLPYSQFQSYLSSSKPLERRALLTTRLSSLPPSTGRFSILNPDLRLQLRSAFTTLEKFILSLKKHELLQKISRHPNYHASTPTGPLQSIDWVRQEFKSEIEEIRLIKENLAKF